VGKAAWNKSSVDGASNIDNKGYDPDVILEELGQRWNAPPSAASTPAMRAKSPNAQKSDDKSQFY